MPSYIVKAAPDQPYYLIWSTIVDAPTAVFANREALGIHLWRQFAAEHPDCAPGWNASPDARIARADATGTSAIEPPGYLGWDDESFLVMESAPPGPSDNGCWMLPRARLVDYCRAILDNDEPAAHACLQWAAHDA